MAKAKCHKCEEKCGKGRADPELILKLDRAYRELLKSDSKSLMRKYLTQEIFNKLKTKKTSFGNTLMDCIQSGLINLDSGIGIYAADQECYSLFADLFDPIIEEYHGGFRKSDVHPPSDFGDISTLGNLDPKGELVVSTRIRCCRSVEGYPFNPGLSEEQYTDLESDIVSALSDLPGELKGQYIALRDMTPMQQQQLIDDHFLFKEGDRFLEAANSNRYWPMGRGIYLNENKTFLVWVNEEDHIRIISMQKGGDIGEVYARWVTAVTTLEKKLKYIRSDRFGYLTFCPTNLGTTIRASVHIKVPKLARDMNKLNDLAGRYNLQVRGTSGEHSEAQDGIYDISNKRRLGLTEIEVVREMYNGILEMIKLEKSST
ncbi:arginine kinase-like [Diorhabda carinulata]|uniref:arginine kinase-like n=1 Tax=Diorhabda carinulata TaxID=1163345 RepID=UPI0025A0C75A|nr:arginine kinase-like [Diorhabda carinulata]